MSLVFDNAAASMLPQWDDPFYVMPIKPVTARSASPWDCHDPLPTGEYPCLGTKIIMDMDHKDADCMATDEFLDLYERTTPRASDRFRPKPALWPMILLDTPFHLLAPSNRIGHRGWRVATPFAQAGLVGYPMLKRPNGTCQNAPDINEDGYAVMVVPRSRLS